MTGPPLGERPDVVVVPHLCRGEQVAASDGTIATML
jgi:hypothetical protein